MKRISSNISCGTTRESVPFAHKDEVTRASVKYTSKQGPSNLAKALHGRTRPRKERNTHPRMERKTHRTEPDPAGSADLQTSYHTRSSDNLELRPITISTYINRQP